MGSNPFLSANGTLENPVFSRVLSIRQKFSDLDFLLFRCIFEPLLCSFSPVNIRIKNRQIPHEIRLFKACIFFCGVRNNFRQTEICRFSKHPVAGNRAKSHMWILAVGVQTGRKKNVLCVLFVSCRNVIASFNVYSQDWG